ncbi:MAG: peptidoglycan DD-metalloendopeptidase family protein [Rhodanobacter sp.]|nr:peptidoglycan DD-metalloendopeptidase family protein [Rhodanobacter sp.]
MIDYFYTTPPARAQARRLTPPSLTQRRHFFRFRDAESSARAIPPSSGNENANANATHWILGGIALLLTAMTGALAPGWANATRHEPMYASQTMTLDLPQMQIPNDSQADLTGAVPSDAPSDVPSDISSNAVSSAVSSDDIRAVHEVAQPNWRIVTVRAGQSLSDIFREQGIGARELQRALDSQKDASALRHIRPRQEFAFAFDANGTLSALRFERGDATHVVLHFNAGGVTESDQERTVERRTHVAHGIVSHSLFDAGNRAGLSDGMVLKLANAFGYDIDFALDLREGDSFSVIYDDVYREGERLRDGDIIAATFVNNGKRYTAIRYTNADGETMLYNENGRPLRKSFLRTPVEFTRISSTFSAGRMHPILGYMRAHKGVDYAAPTGTPIRSAGDGKITFRGWSAGYGNFVVVQHNAHISTAYGHMSRFANEQVGQRVRQGETIGYVGMTGLATGPHLHYEFRIDGAHRDPLTVTLPPPDPLPAKQLAQFRQKIAPVMAKLKTADDMQIALSSH